MSFITVSISRQSGDKVRIIGLHKGQGEALGITLKKTKEGIVIARIIHGGLIGRQGLLSVGDVILEVGKFFAGKSVDLLDSVLI